jgi:hypothetical protein
MRVSIKDGKLAVEITKPEEKKLSQARVVAETIGHLQPIDEKITRAATAVADSIGALVGLCAKAEPPAPILDAIEKNGAVE